MLRAFASRVLRSADRQTIALPAQRITVDAMNQAVLRVQVDYGPFGEMIRAVRSLRKGELVFFLTGDLVGAPNKYTIQLSSDQHVLTRRALWRLVNHSCEPNIVVDVANRRMIAARDIEAGEELTFDYNTTEWSMASPFDCGCGTAACVGVVQGFRHLTGAQRARIAGRLSPYLATRIDDPA